MLAAIWTDLSSNTGATFLIASTWSDLAIALRDLIRADLTDLERIAACDPPAETSQAIERARIYAERIRRDIREGDVAGAAESLAEYRDGELVIDFGPAIRCGRRLVDRTDAVSLPRLARVASFSAE